jgi:hypothetical protein
MSRCDTTWRVSGSFATTPHETIRKVWVIDVFFRSAMDIVVVISPKVFRLVYFLSSFRRH